ncbi:zinc-binding dehydrogenase [Georgenia deserti]|uniref:Zinc-binding dehydrogenase n=1 Tax=Georgenia deserti TaxID=2093781 RepID=A0ABW4L1U9_9MICO
MRAAYLAAPGRVEVDDVPDPAADAPGDLVVRMELASVCGSDVHTVFDGFHEPDALGRPGYPGHEGIGTVVESRARAVPVGTRVLTVPVPAEAGCFAQYQRLPAGQVVPLPDGASVERLLLAQQYGTTLFAMRLFWPDGGATRPAGTAAILGAGSAGLFFVQLARRAGFAQVLVADPDPYRLGVARELGATTTVRPGRESLVEAVLDVTGGTGADLVIEAAGYDAARAECVAAAARQGTVGLFGFPERRGHAGFPMYDAFRKVLRIQWAGGTQSEPGLVAFRDAVREIADGTVEVAHCLGSDHRLEEVPAALELARSGGRGSIKQTIRLA